MSHRATLTHAHPATHTHPPARSFLGLVMSCVELNMGMFQERIRRNFGFLFSFVGRTAFIML